MRNKLLMVVCVASLVGCASEPKVQIAAPAPVIPATAPLQVAPVSVVATAPSWYAKLPENTGEYVYVAGTGLSRDIGMSRSKAVIDAQAHLADRLVGEINTMTKDYKRDLGDEYSQSIEIVSKKVATDVKLIGYQTADSMIYAEGGGYRTYVLIKYPLGNSNRMLQSYLNNKTFKSSKETTERELQQARAENHSREMKNSATVVIDHENPEAAPNSPLGLADDPKEN